MSNLRADMDREIKTAIIPWLRTQGFKGSFPHLRRTGQSKIDLLTFQFDLHSGGYLIEIAQCPLDGIVTHWGKTIPAANAKAWDVHPSRRKRIQANDSAGTAGWFRYDVHPPSEVAALTLKKLSDETLWTDLGPVGPSDKLHLPR